MWFLVDQVLTRNRTIMIIVQDVGENDANV